MTGSAGKYFDSIQKKINCHDIFANEDMDASSEFQAPPADMPKWLEREYSYDYKVCNLLNHNRIKFLI